MKAMSKKVLSLMLILVLTLGCFAPAASAKGFGQSTVSGKTPLLSFSMDELKQAIVNKADGSAYVVLGDAPAVVDSQDGHGKALKLDGSTNYVDLGTKYQIHTSKATIAAWVKVDAAHNELSRIVCRSRTTVPGEKNLDLQVRNNGELETEAGSWLRSDVNAVTYNTWQHVAMTNDGEKLTLYVNGKAVKTDVASTVSNDSQIPLLIGAGWNKDATAPFANHMFKGLLDDLLIYDDALSEEEMSAVMNGGSIEGKTPIIDFDMDSLESVLVNEADSSAYAVLGDAPTVVDSQDGHGKALKLDGSTNYVNLGTKYQITTNKATIAAWVKVDTNPNGLSRIICRSRTAVSGENNLELYVRNNGKLEAQASGWLDSGAGAVTLGEWQHVAVTNDGNKLTLYVNGEAVKTGTAEALDADWQIPLLIGAGWNKEGTSPFTDHMFKGLLDDLLVYDDALTQNEIKALAGVEPEEPGEVTLPEAVYEFTMNAVGDGTGALAGKKVIYDTKGNEYPIYGNYRVDENGIYDKSIVFDGSTTYVNIGKPMLGTTYTLEAWTNISSDTQSSGRLNKIFGRDKTTVGYDAMYLCVRGNGNIEFSVNGPKDSGLGNWLTAGEGTYKFNDWHHIALTFDGTTYKLYYDGEMVLSEVGAAVDLNTNPLDILIGAGYNAEGTDIFAGHAFNGKLDDVRIYDQALSAAQIKKSTEGIRENLPPKVVEVNPNSKMISIEGQVSLHYNMMISKGNAEPTLKDSDGNLVALHAELTDTSSDVDGLDTLVITPDAALTPGKTYTYTVPAETVKNANGVANRASSYTFTVQQALEGNSAESSMKYWVNDFAQKTTTNKSYVKEADQKLVIGNGLVERTFDLSQNFLTVSYKNLYTGIEAVDDRHLQADVRMALCDDFYDEDDSHDQIFYVGGTDSTVPTFQYVNYTVENTTEEIFHWEYNEAISPSFMKDAEWPAAGKAIVVNYKAPENSGIYVGVTVQVRYEIYDAIPVICKRVTVKNTGTADVVVHHLTSEVVPMPVSLEDAIYMEGAMNMDGSYNHDRNNGRLYYTKWLVDGDSAMLMSRYTQGFNAEAAEYGPAYRIKQNESFEAYRVYELFHSNSYYEWKIMEIRAMYQILFPQVLDAPLIYHLISSDSNTVKRGIDEAANAGFNMVLLSFGSGANVEDVSAGNIAKYQELVNYAKGKGIMLGAYIMQVARAGDYQGGWGNMRCMQAPAAQTTQTNNLSFIDQTGLSGMEVDGIYPGTKCTAADLTRHHHEGREDSIVKQWEYGVKGYYGELRERNVYINSPDWSYMTGANMGVMGYVEGNWNVSTWRQLIYSREMSYYGTFEKYPAQGWTMVTLSPYQGGDVSSYWPYNERIVQYDYITAVNMLYGVLGCYRGANGLYQAGAAQNVMETWGEFYNKYRDILGEDIVHIAPPSPVSGTSLNTTDIDGFAHVSAVTEQRALAAFFNQTDETVTRKVKVPLYYTGLTDCGNKVPAPVEGSHYRQSGVYLDLVNIPEVPTIPRVDAVETSKQAYVCIGDMNGKLYNIDSNGNIEVELTMEPNTYTWLTVYDPSEIPSDVAESMVIPAPTGLKVESQTGNSITLSWDAVQIDGRDVKEYHIYRDGVYLGKTFKNSYTDQTVTANQDYLYAVVAVHNTVSGKKAELEVSTRPDTTAPAAESAAADSAVQVTVTFSERLDKNSAETAANYAVANNAVTSAVLSADGKSVVLTLSAALPAFKTVMITVQGVKDLAGNQMSEATLEIVFGYLRHYAFEEENGQTAVDQIMGQNGTIAGTPIERIAEGVSGKALKLNGTNNYVNIATPVSALSNYAITGWFKADNLTGKQTLVGQQRDSYDGWTYELALEDDVLTFAVNNGKGAAPGGTADGEITLNLTSGISKVKNGQWNQLALVRDGDAFTLYLNGEAVDTAERAGIDQTANEHAMWLGAYINNAGGEPTACFSGLMDEVKIYNAVRTAEQIKTEYTALLPEQPTVAVTGVLLDRQSISLKVGERAVLTATVLPENADNRSVVWTSFDPSIASVVDGIVTANRTGSVTITVCTNDGGYTASCAVTVNEQDSRPPVIIPSNPGGTKKPDVVVEFPFKDVAKNSWYYEAVRNAWEKKLIDGVTASEFRPDATLTVAQTIKLAAALYQMENEGEVTLKNGSGSWYDTYVNYAVDNGIIEKSYLDYSAAQMNAAITRAEFVHIFYGTERTYKVINQIADNAIPDVKTGDRFVSEIYTFYRAGILTGSDAKGTFHAKSVIKRSEASAILIRMFDGSVRKSITLK